MDCRFLLQGISLTQQLNLCLRHLLYWQADSSSLVPPRKNIIPKNSSISDIYSTNTLFLITNIFWFYNHLGFPGGASGREPACQCKKCRFNPWAGKIPEGRHGNPLQYSYLENPTERGAWQAMVHRVTKSQTQLKRLSTHST